MEISEKYRRNIIKEYGNWTLLLSPDQLPHVGRSYVWLRDTKHLKGENLPYDMLPDEAVLELKKIFYELRRGYYLLGYDTEQYGRNFRLNGPLPLCNEAHLHKGHMHAHFIPRTREPFKIFGVEVEDKLWGKNYVQPKGGPQLDDETFLLVRDQMIKAVS